MDVQECTRGGRVRALSQMLENQFSAKPIFPGQQETYRQPTSHQSATSPPELEVSDVNGASGSDVSDEECSDAIYQNYSVASRTSLQRTDEPVTSVSCEDNNQRHRITSAYDSRHSRSDADNSLPQPSIRTMSESQLNRVSQQDYSARASKTSLPPPPRDSQLRHYALHEQETAARESGTSPSPPPPPTDVSGQEDDNCSSPKSPDNFGSSMSSQSIRYSVDSFDFDSDYDDEGGDVFPDEKSDDQPVLAPIGVARSTEKEDNASPEDKLHAIAKELLTTEEEYIDSLHIIVKVLLINIQVVNKIEYMLPKETVTKIFSNLQQIYQFHHDTLLPRLRECIYSWSLHQRLGGVLKSVAPFFKLYTDYTKTFKESIDLVTSWTQKNHTFGILIKEIESIPDCKRRKITNLMLEPISRLPKYQALMKTYLQYLPSDAEDRRDTEDALLTITKAAMYSQELGKKDQNFYRLLELQRRLVGKINLLDKPRLLLNEGSVTFIDAKKATEKERYIIMLDDMLLLCAFSGMASVQLRIRESISHKHLKVTDGNNPEFPHSFFIQSKAKTYHVNTRNAGCKATWMKAIRQALNKYSDKISTFVAASNKPVEQPTDDAGVGKSAPIFGMMSAVSMCANCTSAFSAFRKKHHCKGCGKVMCARCLPHKVSLEYDDMKLGKVCDSCNQKILTNSKDVPQLQEKATDSGLLSGFLHISGDFGKSWNKRWFVLNSNKELYSYKAYQDVEPLTRMPVWRYSVERTTPEDEISQPHTFKMANNLNDYIFQADSEATVDKWITALQKCAASQ